MIDNFRELISNGFSTLLYVIAISALMVGLTTLFNSNNYHLLGIFLTVFGFTLTGFTVRKDYLDIRNDVNKGKQR